VILVKKCKSCKTEIDAGASKCPNCQTDQRSWFRRHPILTGLLGLIIFGFVITAIGGGKSASTTNGTSTAQSQTSDKQAAPVASPMMIKVADVADDFDANQVAAKDKWNNKLVEFSAPVANITDSGLSFQNIGTKQYSITQISCRVKDKQQLLTLKNGQTVTVKGVVGGQTIGVIDMHDCEVVK
jgi:hypothetical protein